MKANSRSGEPDSSLSLLLSVRPTGAPHATPERLSVARGWRREALLLLKDDVMLHISVAVKVVPLPFLSKIQCLIPSL